MRIVEEMRAAASLLAVGLPWVERAYQVLPVSQRAREDALPAAALATLLCVIAGYATTRHSTQGLNVGWTALVLFLSAVVALFGFLDLFPRGERGFVHPVLCAVRVECCVVSRVAPRGRGAVVIAP